MTAFPEPDDLDAADKWLSGRGLDAYATPAQVLAAVADDPAIAVLPDSVDNNTGWGVVSDAGRVRVAVRAGDVWLPPDHAEALAAALIRAARKAREAREVTR